MSDDNNLSRRALMGCAVVTAATIPGIAAADAPRGSMEAVRGALKQRLQPVTPEPNHIVKTEQSFLAQGGVRGLPTRNLSAFVAEEVASLNPELVKEIDAAVQQEIWAEHTQHLYQLARAGTIHATLFEGHTVDLPEMLTAAIRTQAKSLSDAKRLITVVGPIGLTLLQTDSSDAFVKTADLSTPEIFKMDWATTPVGYIKGTEDDPRQIEVFIDHYASGSVPILVAGDGWFHYDYKQGVARSETVTGEGRMIGYVSDLNVFPQDINIRRVKLNLL